MLTKQQIRSKILLRLKTQKEDEQDRKSRDIKRKLSENASFRKAKSVMFYVSFDGEVNTEDMIKVAQKQGKTVTVPVCGQDRTLKPYILGARTRLKSGPYGTKEPVKSKAVSPQDLDLVVVPGVAFDKKGRRLGRGKGYYDRFLSKLPRLKPTIGLAFDFQILPILPAADHDVSVTKVIFA
ncbi:5-formyltetrahydrofolate cyclo-ligase [Candidatus Omnitrophota bacterium]